MPRRSPKLAVQPKAPSGPVLTVGTLTQLLSRYPKDMPVGVWNEADVVPARAVTRREDVLVVEE